MKVEIGKNLARKIPNGKSYIFSREKKTFIFWKSYPVFTLSLDNTGVGRIVENGFFTKRENEILVISHILLMYNRLEMSVQYIFIDIHKKSRYIEFQNIYVFLIVFCCRSHEIINTSHSKKCPLSYSATIGVMNE